MIRIEHSDWPQSSSYNAFLSNIQIDARSLISQLTMVHCAGKLMI